MEQDGCVHKTHINTHDGVTVKSNNIALLLVQPGTGGCCLQAMAAAVSSCWMSDWDRPVTFCSSRPETHSSSLADFILPGGSQQDLAIKTNMFYMI